MGRKRSYNAPKQAQSEETTKDDVTPVEDVKSADTSSEGLAVDSSAIDPIPTVSEPSGQEEVKDALVEKEVKPVEEASQELSVDFSKVDKVPRLFEPSTPSVEEENVDVMADEKARAMEALPEPQEAAEPDPQARQEETAGDTHRAGKEDPASSEAKTQEAPKAVMPFVNDAELKAQLKHVVPDDYLNAMDRKTMLTYIEYRSLPKKTPRGNHPIDVRRTSDLRSWKLSALLDWMDGFLKAPKDVLEEDLWDELYRRHQIPSNWTWEAAKAYIEHGVRPAYTKDGVLIDDRMRSKKTLGQWTFAEIRAALLQQITSPASSEELINLYRIRMGLRSTYSAQRILDTINESPTEANLDNTMLRETLSQYKDAMTKNGNNLTADTAGQNQVMLYKAIRQVLKRDMKEFVEGWNILLDWINENYNALFTDELARRGWTRMKLSKPALATFEDVLTLMVHTRVPNTRAREAQLFNLPQIMRFITDEKERQNLSVYYNTDFQG